MLKTQKMEVSSKNLCVDIKGLQELLGVGIATARKIGSESKAGFNVGKRKLYKVDKVNTYLETLIQEEAALNENISSFKESEEMEKENLEALIQE